MTKYGYLNFVLRKKKENVHKIKKRVDTDGFSRHTMVERFPSIKLYSADWQSVDKQHAIMATLIQKFQHSRGSEIVVQHICPWSMKDVITQLLGHSHCLSITHLVN